MDILVLWRQGLTQRKIARRLGISRNTVKKYIEEQTQPLVKRERKKRQSILDSYMGNITAYLEEDESYQATWIYDQLLKMGYTGSYETVKRKVHELKERHQRIAYQRFETEPGHQGQVDFGEFQIRQADGSIRKVYLFSMILGYSRKIYGEFIGQCDLPAFLDCHIHAFEYFGGVPDEILYDRMRNVFIGKIGGKDKFNDTLVGFAYHYGFKPKVAPAYAAWVKGKVERPYRFIREGFWRGYGYSCIETANRDLAAWLEQKEDRIHGTTHERVSERFKRERPCLNRLPHTFFDTSYRIYRKVYKDCTFRFDSNSYVVPHTLVGETVTLRVKGGSMRIFHGNTLIVTYAIPDSKGHLIQDKRFYEALRQDQEMNRRKYHRSSHPYGKRGKGRAKGTISPSKPLYDMDVEVRPSQAYDALIFQVQP